MNATDEILAHLDALPPLPGTALRLIEILNQPDSRIEEIVDCVRYDPVVTASILRQCNSAQAGLRRTITSIDEASRYLGTMRILQVVLARNAAPLLAREQQGYGLEPGRLWRHSVAVALASAAFAKRVSAENSRLAFTAGLLHDIGKIALNQHVGAAIEEILRKSTEEDLSFVEAEQKVLGCTHEEIGARLGRHWQLPEPVIRCIANHHDPERLSPPDTLVDTIYLANAICVMFGIGVGADELRSKADPAVVQRLNLDSAACEEIGAQILIELRAVEESFAGLADRPVVSGVTRNQASCRTS